MDVGLIPYVVGALAGAMALPRLKARLELSRAKHPSLYRVHEGPTPEKLAAALAEVMADGPVRAAQIAALARIPGLMRLPQGTPSEAAAGIVLGYAGRTRA